MIKVGPFWLSLFVTLVWGAVVLAGGFQLSVEVPDSSTDPQLKGAVLLVRTYGCHQPTDATLTAMAEGLVKGRRQSLPVKLTPTSTGVYAIRQQWPAEGTWVLAITGTYRGMISSALVELGPNGKVQAEPLGNGHGKGRLARIVQRKLNPGEIESVLQARASN
jgi:hypothetical protein